MKKFFLFALIIFCGSSAFGQSKTAEKEGNLAPNKKAAATRVSLSVTDEEYAVYAAVLEKNGKMFVIRDKIYLNDYDKPTRKEHVKEYFEELDDETFEDYKTKNEEPAQMEKKFPKQVNYTLITTEELENNFAYKNEGNLDWEGFRKKYPESNGLYTFSRVGFSLKANQALVFVTNWCRSLCGEGNYYLLKKENGEWKVTSQNMVWIS